MNRLTGKSDKGGVTKHSFVRSLVTLNSVNKEGLKKLYNELHDRLLPYEKTGIEPDGIVNLQKAFALACRILEDTMDCPAADCGYAWPECYGERDECGAVDRWECWQRYLLERAENEAVCRVCGCTQDNACKGGCSWIEPDLCSSCAESVCYSQECQFKDRSNQHTSCPAAIGCNGFIGGDV